MLKPPYGDDSKILLHLGKKGSFSQMGQFSKPRPSFLSEIPWHRHQIRVFP